MKDLRQSIRESNGSFQSRSGNQTIRIGFISTTPPQDPNALSGMPYSMWHALDRQGAELISLCPVGQNSHGQITGALNSLLRRAGHTVLSKGSRNFLRACFRGVKILRHRISAGRDIIASAVRNSQTISSLIAQNDLDILFGICISSPLYRLETDQPIVYCSDATASLINSTYPEYSRRGVGYRKACDELERVALSRVRAAAFPSQRTLDSAVEEYGLSPDKAHLVPFGANVLPPPGMEIRPDSPNKGNLNLVLVAADPKRKRLDLCIDVVETLRQRGWTATLNYIGPETPRALTSEAVKCLGPLRLEDPDDRKHHQETLRDSHFMLLPSFGEMFGIAPAEAAHFGRPSLVSNVGGLPTVVQHNRTGMVLRENASSPEYADAVELISNDRELYMNMSRAALQRARKELTWDAWARTILAILRKVAFL